MGKSTSHARRGTDMFMSGRPKDHWLVSGLGLVIRARAFLFVVALVVASVVWLRSWLDPVTADVVLIGTVVVVLVLPWSRRFVVARFWCVVDRHRLRACLRMAKIRTMNLDGSLPFMLWARPTKTGERVWLWVRAGASGDDIEDVLSYIAPACYAREARLHRVRSLSTLVAVELIRRDPLAKKTKLVSPLAKLTSLVTGEVRGEGTESIRAASITDITTVAPIPVQEQRKPMRKTTSNGVAEPAVSPRVVVSGEDLSDYVD